MRGVDVGVLVTIRINQMNNYDLSKLLSPLRFEQICRDLLRSKFGQFENFSDGPDEGIDFRYSLSADLFLIVQCKRYSNKSTLIANLKKEAAKKVSKVGLSKYILVVSIELTPKNKDQILEFFNGKIKSPNEIITLGDLNDLLSQEKNESIELKYPELWMGSINIHQKLFHKGLLDHSKFLQNKIYDSITKFVPNQNYFSVLNILASNNVVIISGIPGAGKTTVSYAVAAHFMNFHEYRVIDISYRKLNDVESFILTKEPTIFLFDDFLGRIKLEKKDSFGQLLNSFVERITSSVNTKLIITTRENILRTAERKLESIELLNQTYIKHIVQLKHYTRKIRTQILFNHLKKSDLDQELINNLLDNDITKIVDHKNYSPRLIDLSTKNNFFKELLSENYFEEFLKNLDSPARIWKKSYDGFPNDLYKAVLLYIFIASDPLPVDKLESTINHLIKHSDKFISSSYDEFEYIIKDLEGTFITFIDSYDELMDHEYIIVEFANQSIRDFINGFIWRKHNWLEMLIENALYFEHLFSWELLEKIEKNEKLLRVFRTKLLKDFNKLENASLGYFDYETEEGTFTSWRGEKYIFYLAKIDSIFDLNKEPKIAKLLKAALFKRPFDGTEDLSEKISFVQVARSLINSGLISGEKAVKHYICDILSDIKELVYLVYLIRGCNKDFQEQLVFKKDYRYQADELFLFELENISDLNLINIFDLFDDFHQVKSILELPKTSSKIGELDIDSILEHAGKNLQKPTEISTPRRKNQTKNDYNDIKDESIKSLFDQLKNSH